MMRGRNGVVRIEILLTTKVGDSPEGSVVTGITALPRRAWPRTLQDQSPVDDCKLQQGPDRCQHDERDEGDGD